MRGFMGASGAASKTAGPAGKEGDAVSLLLSGEIPPEVASTSQTFMIN